MATEPHYNTFIKSLTRAVFVNTVASILQFAQDNYTMYPDGMPDEAEEAVAYAVACYYAQRFDDGVESEEIKTVLRPKEAMTYGKRLALVNGLFGQFKDGSR